MSLNETTKRMYQPRIGTCRLCHEMATDYVRYAMRHVAHAHCLVERKGWSWMFANLKAWQLADCAEKVAHAAIVEMPTE